MEKQSKQQFILFTIMSPVKSEIKLSMFLSSISTLCSLFSLTIVSFILTYFIEGGFLEILGTRFTLGTLIVILAVFTLMSFVLKYVAFNISHIAAFKLERLLRLKIINHLSKVTLGYIVSNGSGTFNKIILNDVKSLHAFVADSIPMLAKSIVSPIVTMLILFIVDYRFAIVSILILLLGWFCMSYAMRDAKTLRQKYDQSQININKSVIEFVQAIPVVRTFEDGSSSFKRYNKALDDYKENLNQWMSQSAVSAKLSMIILSPLPTLIAVLLMGLILLNNSSLELFSFIVALILSTGMADSLLPIMWLQNYIKKSNASAIKIDDLLSIKPLPIAKNPITPSSFNLKFEDVSFKYEDKYVLKGINFEVTQNLTVAIVGTSGAGKSTIAKLISRFWDTSSGKITIDGVDIKDINPEELMNHVSFVFQDSFVFNDTILNNIKIANANASKDEVVNAAKSAQIHEFILTLPQGYETKVTDRGSNLSGGQKQRLTIARAILRDSSIVVLDEPTSSSDSKNEEKIVKALANLTKNKTVILIAHRLSIITDANKIIVLDKGEIVESGKHNELYEKNGLYKRLWDISKGDIDG